MVMFMPPEEWRQVKRSPVSCAGEGGGDGWLVIYVERGRGLGLGERTYDGDPIFDSEGFTTFGGGEEGAVVETDDYFE